MSKALARITAFFQMPAAPGICIFIAAVLALALKNSPLEWIYAAIRNTQVVVQAGEFAIDKPLLLWINDGLMAIFFLLVGLEIKREILTGHLSSRKKMALPLIAAVGGVIAPALIYAYINRENPTHLHGWAIPSATDIAFALGVMMMLGKRVPAALKVLLVAIAIIDDLAAIVIIALFYTANVSTLSLALAAAGFAVIAVMNRGGVRRIGPYMIMGLLIWACVLKSGVHATLAGVVLGFMIPADGAKSPSEKLEHALHPWSSFLILPLFAFVNSGVSLSGLGLDTFMQPVTLGIILGLFAGKQTGVMLFSWAGIRLGLCALPPGIGWREYYGMAILTGIGFTMSLFIGTLAFHSAADGNAVRIGVLAGSLLSGILGTLILLRVERRRRKRAA